MTDPTQQGPTPARNRDETNQRIRRAATRAQRALERVEQEHGPWDERTTRAREAAGLCWTLDEAITHAEAIGAPDAAVQKARRFQAEQAERLADEAELAAGTRGRDTTALLPRWAQAGGRDSLLDDAGDEEA